MGVEITTLVLPEFWGGNSDARFWIDILYFAWIFSGLSMLPKWVWLFVLWALVQDLIGRESGLGWIQQVDAVVSLGFIVYRLIVMESGKYIQLIEFLMNKNIISVKLGMAWLRVAAMSSFRTIRHLWKLDGGGDIGILIYQVCVISKTMNIQISLTELSGDEITLQIGGDNILFSAKNRILQITRTALGFHSLEKAYGYLLNYSEV